MKRENAMTESTLKPMPPSYAMTNNSMYSNAIGV